MKAEFKIRDSRFKRAARRTSRFRLSISAVCFLVLSGVAHAQSSIRLAVVDLAGDDRGEATSLLRSLASASKSPSLDLPSFDPIDDDLVKAAARGAGYDGSLNLSRDEARALGQSLGCDFYLLGKVLIARRAVSAERFYFEALSGLFLVEARTGALTLFTLDRAKADGDEQARALLKELIASQWSRCAKAAILAWRKRAVEIENVGKVSAPLIEVFSDDFSAQGIEPPVFYQRLKPAYTEEADLAGITATVELEAVFGDDGRVGEVEVARWAGFGLDEAAMATVRQLRFKPARRDGKNVTIRGLVRYTFRRPNAQAVAPQTASPAEIERIRRALREALNPKQFPAKPPNF